MERYLRVNLLGPGPSSYEKKNLPGRGLTKVEKHCSKGLRWFPEQLTLSQKHDLLSTVSL